MEFFCFGFEEAESSKYDMNVRKFKNKGHVRNFCELEKWIFLSYNLLTLCERIKQQQKTI